MLEWFCFFAPLIVVWLYGNKTTHGAIAGVILAFVCIYFGIVDLKSVPYVLVNIVFIFIHGRNYLKCR